LIPDREGDALHETSVSDKQYHYGTSKLEYQYHISLITLYDVNRCCLSPYWEVRRNCTLDTKIRHRKRQPKSLLKQAEEGLNGGGLESYRQATKLLSKCVKTNEAERTNKARWSTDFLSSLYL